MCPNNKEALSKLGEALSELGYKDRAISNYRKVIEIDPKDKEANFQLANTLFSNGEKKEAIHFYRKIISVDPNC